MITSKELPAAELSTVPTTVLAGVFVSSEEESVGDLTPKSAGNMDEPHQANDGRTRQTIPLRTELPRFVHFQDFSLPV
jgi:hypothetical protein